MASYTAACAVLRPCRDPDGHGTHVAGTAVGNYGVPTPYSHAGSVISGMAPRARLAVYKVRTGNGLEVVLSN